jgi:hypothetical protein
MTTDGGRTVFHGLGVYAIAIVFIHNKEVLVA